MKNKLLMLILAGTCFFASCAGNRAPQQGNDTVSKADVTKDTLNIDTNKNSSSNKAGKTKAAKDTLKQALPVKQKP